MNTPQNDGGAVYPHEAVKWDDAGLYVKDNSNYHPGMTLRDWFAGQALPSAIEWYRLKGKEEIYRDGFIEIHEQPCMPDYDTESKEIARCCYAIAEAMLAHRNEREEP